MPRAVFAAEASPAIGGGHVMRSLALAHSLMGRGWQCSLAARPETFAIWRPDVFLGIGQISLGAAEATPDQFGADLPQVIVFDRYVSLTQIERAWQEAGTTVVVIDDLADQFHHADILLNQNQPNLEVRYAGLLAPGCATLFGPEFALLRPEFATARNEALARRAEAGLPQRVFVNFGLTDPAGGCLRAIAALERAQQAMDVHVAIGSAARDIGELEARAAQSRLTITIHIDPPDLAGIMAMSDYAIAAGGSSAWERCTLGLPTIVMSIANNQDTSCALLAQKGAGINLGKFDMVNIETIVDSLDRIHGDGAFLRRMSLSAAALCDGRGAERVAGQIEAVVSGAAVRSAPPAFRETVV